MTIMGLQNCSWKKYSTVRRILQEEIAEMEAVFSQNRFFRRERTAFAEWAQHFLLTKRH